MAVLPLIRLSLVWLGMEGEATHRKLEQRTWEDKNMVSEGLGRARQKLRGSRLNSSAQK